MFQFFLITCTGKILKEMRGGVQSLGDIKGLDMILRLPPL